MDAVNSFMEAFSKQVRTRDKENLKALFRCTSRKIIKDVPKDEMESVLLRLFDEHRGILKFLKDELQNYDNDFVPIVTEGFQYLTFIIEQCSAYYLPFIHQTKSLCQMGLVAKISLTLKRIICATFDKLLTMCNEYDMNIGNVTVVLVEKLRLNYIKSTRERAYVYKALGSIVKYNSDNILVQDCTKYLFDALIEDLKKDITSSLAPSSSTNSWMGRKRSEKPDTHLYFQALNDMLNGALPYPANEEKQQSYFKLLYAVIRSIVDRPTDKTIHVIESCLQLFYTRIHNFEQFVYQDYKYWYEYFAKSSLSLEKYGQVAEGYAIRSFYRTIGRALRKDNTPKAKEVFVFFKEVFTGCLTETVDVKMLNLIVYSMCQLSVDCRRFLTEREIEDMYLMVAYRAIPLFLDKEDDVQVYNVPEYQEALSSIIYNLPHPTYNHLNVLEHLCVLLIKRFPELTPSNKSYAAQSLLRTTLNIAKINNQIRQDFMRDILYKGVLYSCSHTLFIDAELHSDLNDLQKRIICYKDYLPLWKELLLSKGETSVDEMRVMEDMFDEMLSICTIFLKKLNLNTKKLNTNDDATFTDVSLDLVAENPDDFRIFINMVDLYIDVLKHLPHLLSRPSVITFLEQLIRMSYSRPLISGFYKLVHVVLKTSEIFNSTIAEIGQDRFDLILHYLLSTISLTSAFSGELQNACLCLILDAPLIFVKSLIEESGPIYKIAFRIGLSYLPLAAIAMNSLEKWSHHSDISVLRDFTKEILPSLELYLQSKESLVELAQESSSTEKKIIKRVTLIDKSETLEELQKRILLYMGSISSDVIMEHIHEQSLRADATWDKKDLIKYELPLAINKLEVHFDKLLPRIVELAQHSGDRQTKVAACECLFSIVTILLGYSSMPSVLSAKDFKYGTLFESLYPVLLKLGSDTDEVTRQLFQPFCLQLTHWLSSRIVLLSGVKLIESFLNSLFEGLQDESDANLRDFSGDCLAEFAKWAIKQSSDEQLRSSPINITEIVRRILNCSSHPSSRKRVAGAIAFNHIYTILREDHQIIKNFWLVFLYIFVKSLSGCNDERIHAAISHVERVILSRAQIFNVERGRDNQPPEFRSNSLKGAAFWLLEQCGSDNQECRVKSMDLFVKISSKVERFSSPGNIAKNYIETIGDHELKSILFRDLHLPMEKLNCQDLKVLLRSLDCFIWTMEQELVSSEFLLPVENETAYVFVRASVFIKFMMCKHEGVIHVSREEEELKDLQCQIILRLLDFINVLLALPDNEFSKVPNFFWDADFFAFISNCAFNQRSFKFNKRQLEFTDNLLLKLKRLMILSKTKFETEMFANFCQSLLTNVQKHQEDYYDLTILDNVSLNLQLIKLDYVKGLILIEESDLLSFLSDVEITSLDVLKSVFDFIRTDTGHAQSLRPEMQEYVKSLVKLVLIDFKEDVLQDLISKLLSSATMTSLERYTQKTTHGIYFINLFDKEVFEYLIKDPEETMKLLFADLDMVKIDIMLSVAEKFTEFIAGRTKNVDEEKREALATSVLERFLSFERVVGNQRDRVTRLVNIMGAAVACKAQPPEILETYSEVYEWIANTLSTDEPLEFKNQVLRRFLPCFSENPALGSVRDTVTSLMFDKLKTERKRILEEGNSTEISKVIETFHILIEALHKLRSTVIFKYTIKFTAGIGEHSCYDKLDSYLQTFYNTLDDKSAVESLEIAYKLFMKTNVSVERFDILEKFLLPSIEVCRANQIEEFFVNNIKDIYENLQQKFQHLVNQRDVERIIINKIGGFELASKMFSKLDADRVNSPESAIFMELIEGAATGQTPLKLMFKSSVFARGERVKYEVHRELNRKLHCSAYNCCITIVSTKSDTNTYKNLFRQDVTKGLLIWENIIDCNKRYALSQEFKEIPKRRKKLVNIRSKLKEQQGGLIDKNFSYIHSYNIASSTLTEDVGEYDFHRTAITTANEGESLQLTFEVDELNDHECMKSICGLLYHAMSIEVLRVPDTTNSAALPDWLDALNKEMLYIYGHYEDKFQNIVLFFLKMILNNEKIFRSYAKTFVKSILRIINQYLSLNAINYVITDILEMLIEWQVVAIPDEDDSDKKEAQNLIELLMRRMNHQNSSVQNYNLKLTKTLVDVWSSCLRVPTFNLLKNNLDEETCIVVILTFLKNGLEGNVIEDVQIMEFLSDQCQNHCNDPTEKIVVGTFECLSLILAHAEFNVDYQTQKERILTLLHNVMLRMQRTDILHNRVIKCANIVCVNYPPLTVQYFEDFASKCISKVDIVGKKRCLETFLLAIPKLSKEKAIYYLSFLGVESVFENKITGCEKVSLQVIEKVVPLVSFKNISRYIHFIVSYADSDFADFREVVYDVFIAIHKHYAEEGGTSAIKALLHLSNKILMKGLLDPVESVQGKLLKFWTEEILTNGNSSGRLLECLSKHSPETEQFFMQFVSLTLLNLVAASPNYEDKLFNYQLHECNYQDYPISVLRRVRNLKSSTPLFAVSLASTINRSMSNSSLSTNTEDFTTQVLQRSLFLQEIKLRATQKLQFDATQTNVDEPGPVNDQLVFKVPKVPEPADYKRSFRFRKSTTLTRVIKDTTKEPSMQEETERARDNMIRRKNDVKLYRKYRIGDFPDIEIRHSNVISPLTELLKKDQIVCKGLLVEIIKSTFLAETVNYQSTIIEKFNDILASYQESNSFLNCLLEVILYGRIIDIPAKSISRITKSSGLCSLGALILEEQLLANSLKVSEPDVKRRRLETSQYPNSKEWIELAGLYKVLNDVDAVLSIFRTPVAGDDLKEASFAQFSGDWKTAKSAFQRAYDAELDELKEHCRQESYQCASQLMQWGFIAKTIETTVEKNYNSLWRERCDDKWMLPWFFRSHLQQFFVKRQFSEDFVDALRDWHNERSRSIVINRHYGEEMAIIHLQNEDDTEIGRLTNQEKARDCLNNNLDWMRKEWVNSNPLASNIKFSKFFKLRGAANIDTYLKFLKSEDKSEGAMDLMKTWRKNLPANHDDLLISHTFVSYRLLFADAILQDEEIQLNEEITRKLKRNCFKQRLRVANLSLHRNNRYVSKFHIAKNEYALQNQDGDEDLKPHFHLSVAKYKYLCGKLDKNPQARLRHFTESWESSHLMLNEDDISADMRVEIKRHLTELSSSLISFLDEHSESIDCADAYKNMLNTTDDDTDAFRLALQEECCNNLKYCCSCVDDEDKGASYYALAKYCYELIPHCEDNVQWKVAFMQATLRAMTYGCREAVNYFPCLMSMGYLENDGVREIFEREIKTVESWHLLAWQAQLLSHLKTTLRDTAISLIKRIVKDYPNAIMQAFTLAVENDPDLLNNWEIREISDQLFTDKTMEKFNNALLHLVQPESLLCHWIDETLKNFHLGKATVVSILTKNVFEEQRSPRGRLFNHVLLPYKEKLMQVVDKTDEEAKQDLLSMKSQLQQSFLRRKDSENLADYSPYLMKIRSGEIEVPGQYTGDTRPMPQYHKKIVRFEAKVNVIFSQRKPIKFTIVGNDAKNYTFLMKFGEDLRLDQRIQQLFEIMNKILKGDAACRDRNLHINTYQVIPLSKTTGLIQWIDDAKSLKDFVYFSLGEVATIVLSNIDASYEKWIKSSAPSASLSKQYKESTNRYNAEAVLRKMSEFMLQTELDALRKTFVALTLTPDGLFFLRRNFITSYATMCIAHWILGIGDRHLENTLISIKTGGSIGIDFDLAFGAGVDLIVPELMPFRLTPQIVEFLKPFKPTDTFATTMIHVLKALRVNKALLTATLNIFIDEPLNWEEKINKLAKQNNEDNLDIKWLPKKQVETVVKKLNGVKPSTVIVEQLESSTYLREYRRRYVEIASGSETSSSRSNVRDENLTAEEQVECLIDQATDWNLLGRVYKGWTPWL